MCVSCVYVCLHVFCVFVFPMLCACALYECCSCVSFKCIPLHIHVGDCLPNENVKVRIAPCVKQVLLV